MRAPLWVAGLALLSSSLPAQAPNTDIFLAPLSRLGDSIVVGTPVNVTHRPGYDNQPGWLPDGRGILYTAVGADAQADIWRYDLAEHRTSRVTATPESEYSATVMPGGRRFSVIRVEHDSTQRLWSFAMDGSDPQLVLTELKPVGYHVWLNDHRLVTYVLGSPSTLHVIDRDGSHDEIRARDVGRAVQRIPGRDAFSYTQRDSAHRLWITSQPTDGGAPTRIAQAMSDNEFHSWLPDGTLITASGRQLYRLRTSSGDSARWIPFADFAGAPLRNVTRLAVSPDGTWLAFVAEPVEP